MEEKPDRSSEVFLNNGLVDYLALWQRMAEGRKMSTDTWNCADWTQTGVTLINEKLKNKSGDILYIFHCQQTNVQSQTNTAWYMLLLCVPWSSIVVPEL